MANLEKTFPKNLVKKYFPNGVWAKLSSTFGRSLTILMSILAAAVVGSILMLFYGQNPLNVYRLLFVNAFGSARGWFITLQRATPLIFTAIASTIAFRTGVFNVGVEGQFLIGAITGTYVGYAIQLPTAIHLPLTLLAGALGGAFLGLYPHVDAPKTWGQ